MEDLKKPLKIIFNKRAETLNKYNDKYNNLGKIIVGLLFGLSFSFSILSIIDFILICYMMNQYNCSCCRCLFKFGFVIIWNFFTLTMIFSFFMGSILSLIGRIGNNLALAFPYIISQDNFGRENPIISQQFETGKKY